MQDKSEAQLFLIGLGVNPWEHATIRALKCLKMSDLIYCTPIHEVFVKAHAAESSTVVTLTPHQRTMKMRSELYADFADVIAAPIDQGKKVAWVTEGDPTINCGVSAELLHKKSSIAIEIVSGISASIAVNALIPERDRTDSIVQIVAKQLFNDDLVLETRFCHHVIQLFQHISQGELPYLRARPSCFLPIQHRLLRYYPSAHACHLVVAPTEHDPQELVSFSLGDLTEQSNFISPRTTLVIPPLPRETQISQELANLWAMNDDEKFFSPLETLAVLSTGRKGGY